MNSYQLLINGATHDITAAADTPILSVLRDALNMSGPRFGCGAGECGACRILVDGYSVPSCDLPVWSVIGKEIVTVEGLGSADSPHPLQKAFIAEQAMQCGYCVSGILISAAALLRQTPRPSETEIRNALDRNLCRCGAHNRMVRAVLRASEDRTE